jgi:glucose/arabinose dehydrogenase
MGGSASAAVTYPADFQETTMVSGLTQPTAAEWAPDGRMFIAEKPGRVKVVQPGSSTAVTILDITSQVNESYDRGLLDIALDANFDVNGYMYLLYAVEKNPLMADTDAPTYSRLTRVQVSATNAVSAETTILGSQSTCVTQNLATTWPSGNDLDCIPAEGRSHAIGTVLAAPDGTLYVGSGDASSYAEYDPLAFRVYDEQSLAGKIVHIDRSGNGLPGHSFCPTDTNLAHVCTKLYAKGFRNPFRFKLRADGSLSVGDVGWSTREEIDIVRSGGKSYGWPCYEGTIQTPTYQDQSKCATEYAKPAGTHTPPNYDYQHQGSNAIISGPRYTGGPYPDSFDGSTFFGDYAFGFLKRVTFDSQDKNPVVQDFATGWSGVDLMMTPGGEIAYADMGDFGPGNGSIKRIVYLPSAGTPTAVASATPRAGGKPLTVQFNGSGSSDPEGDTLSYDWSFGDGTAHSTAANPSHQYLGAGTFTATLTVNDGHGHSDTASVQVSVFNSPPTPVIASPAAGSTYRDGDTIQLQGSATDAQDPASAIQLSWNVTLHHGSHTHAMGSFAGPTAQFTAPRDHDGDSYFEIRLRATDTSGEWSETTREIHPETVPFALASVPSGAPVTYGGTSRTAPYSTNSAIGLQTTIGAGDSFTTADGRKWYFASWSDGGARSHQIEIPAFAQTLTASYYEDKANGRPATASSVEGNPDNVNLVPGKAVDDNATTRWASEKGTLAYPATNEWWQVDLGSSRQVGRVELDWEAAYASKFKILTSTDGVNFALAADATATSAGTTVTNFPVRSARYVRVQGVERGTVYGISFWQARVLGPPDGTSPPADTTPPDTTLTATPPATTTNTGANFSFTSTEPGSTFTCKLDGAQAGCTSPKSYANLSLGGHTFSVYAVDGAGNADPTPASYSWTIEAAPTGERQEKASGRPATASSVEGNPDNPNLVAGMAVDGSSATRWASEKGPLAYPATNEWWQVDLGSVRKVDTVELDWEAAYASKYKILTSTDGASFTLAADETATAAGKRVTTFAARDARYVRVQGVERGTAYGISFWEARVLGPPDGTADTTPPDTTLTATPPSSTTSTSASFNFTSSEAGGTFTCTLDGAQTGCTSPKSYSGLAPGSHTFSVYATDAAGNVDRTPASWTWTVQAASPGGRQEKARGETATASSVEGNPDNVNLVPGKAVDANSATRWASEKGALAFPSTDQWWQVDLGSVRTVDTVELEWEAAYASKYKVLTSTDGVNFTLAADATASSAGLRSTSFATRSARYVRIQGVERGTTYGISFWEARVMGPAEGADTTAPDTTITSNPPATTTSTSAQFAFTSEAGAFFRCKLDGLEASCVSPKSYSGLAPGGHTFTVYATDAAGNIDPTPATYSWTVG